MTCVVLKPMSPEEQEPWITAFHTVAPELTIRSWDDPALDPESVDFAFAWEPDGLRLAQMKNLRAVISPAAGVDHIIRDPHYPRAIPIYRMGGDETAEQMGDYICWAAFTLLRDAWRWQRDQARKHWAPWLNQTRTAGKMTVGVMGLGHLGQATALRLKGAGFNVVGWARSAHILDGVKTFHGTEGFVPFLNQTDILVSLLPATPQTVGILNARTFSHLRPGASIINAGRGTQLVQDDLIEALDNGTLHGAVLDVFPQEPLPEDSPLWTCQGLTISPHMASEASYTARAAYAASVIRTLLEGKEAPLRYDANRGY